MNAETPESATSGPPDWRLPPGAAVWVGGHNLDARRAVEELVQPVNRPPSGPIEAAFITPVSAEEGLYFLGKLRPRLNNAGRAWVILPRAEEGDAVLTSIESGATALGFAVCARVPLGEGFDAICFRCVE